MALPALLGHRVPQRTANGESPIGSQQDHLAPSDTGSQSACALTVISHALTVVSHALAVVSHALTVNALTVNALTVNALTVVASCSDYAPYSPKVPLVTQIWLLLWLCVMCCISIPLSHALSDSQIVDIYSMH